MPESAALSRSRIAKLIEEGCVWKNGAAVTSASAPVAEGDRFDIDLPEVTESHIAPESLPLDVVYEDDDIIVVNKAAGMVVHPAPGSPSGTLVNAVLAHAPDIEGIGGVGRPGVVHRIDKLTSGLLVMAKSDRAHHGLSEQFAAHSVERSYTAICFGCPDQADPRLRGTRGVSFEAGGVIKITTGLDRHKTDRQRQAVTFSGGRHAVTRIKVTRSFGRPNVAAQVECTLETGRTHQIRVHMAHIGHSLVGDPVYGRSRQLRTSAVSADAAEFVQKFARQALHARTLGFAHPLSGDALSFSAEVPPDLAQLIEILSE